MSALRGAGFPACGFRRLSSRLCLRGPFTKSRTVSRCAQAEGGHDARPPITVFLQDADNLNPIQNQPSLAPFKTSRGGARRSPHPSGASRTDAPNLRAHRRSRNGRSHIHHASTREPTRGHQRRPTNNPAPKHSPLRGKVAWPPPRTGPRPPAGPPLRALPGQLQPRVPPPARVVADRTKSRNELRPGPTTSPHQSGRP